MFEDVENNIKRQDTFNYTHKHAPTQYWFNPVPQSVMMNTQNVFAMPGIEDVMIHLTIESDD